MSCCIALFVHRCVLMSSYVSHADEKPLHLYLNLTVGLSGSSASLGNGRVRIRFVRCGLLPRVVPGASGMRLSIVVGVGHELLVLLTDPLTVFSICIL